MVLKYIRTTDFIFRRKLKFLSSFVFALFEDNTVVLANANDKINKNKVD